MQRRIGGQAEAAEAAISTADDIPFRPAPRAGPPPQGAALGPGGGSGGRAAAACGDRGDRRLGLTGRPLPVPVWVVTETEPASTGCWRGRGAGAQLDIGGAQIVIDERFVPRLRLDAVKLVGKSVRTVAVLPEVRIALQKGALLEGAFRPERLTIEGAQIRLRRTEDGRFDLDFGGETDETGPGSFAEILDRVDAAFRAPALGGLRRVEAEVSDPDAGRPPCGPGLAGGRRATDAGQPRETNSRSKWAWRWSATAQILRVRQ